MHELKDCALRQRACARSFVTSAAVARVCVLHIALLRVCVAYRTCAGTMSSGAVIVEHCSVHAQARQRQRQLAEFAGAKERRGRGVSADEVRVVVVV